MFVYPLTRPVYAAAHRAAATQQLNRAIERLFDDTTGRFVGGAKPDSAVRTPALDVAENDTTYSVVLDVPGATREQLKVTIEGRRLSVETIATADVAANEAAPAKDGERVLLRERGAARYARSVILPAEVDQAASQAKVENGVLTLTLVKKVPTGARQISIS
jgi:HSP20 family protein